MSFEYSLLDPSKLHQPEILETAFASKFSMNTDGSSSGNLSSSHQGNTATGIGNGGEILGYTLPLDRALRNIKPLPGKSWKPSPGQAAILEFETDEMMIRLLAVGNDTGGRHIGGDRKNRGWGEIGINTWRHLKEMGMAVKLGRNYLSVPQDLECTYYFLDRRIRVVNGYRKLKKLLEDQGRI